eukprot:2624320-Pyramimonas_sp.AAC.1
MCPGFGGHCSYSIAAFKVVDHGVKIWIVMYNVWGRVPGFEELCVVLKNPKHVRDFDNSSISSFEISLEGLKM